MTSATVQVEDAPHRDGRDTAGAHVAAVSPRLGSAVLGSAWALADQATLSLGNFLTNLVLLRFLAPAAFGTYALLFGTLMFAGSLHAALVVYPLSIGTVPRGGRTRPGSISRGVTAGGALALTGVLWLPLSACLVAAAALLGRIDLAPWAIAALLLWLVQETLRRALLADLRHRAALIGDAVSYLGQAAVVWGLALRDALSIESALMAIAATSAAGALVQAFQVGLRRLPRHLLAPTGLAFWRDGRWLLLVQCLGLLTVYATPWTLMFFHGGREVAQFQAVAVLLGVANPVTAGMIGLIVPAVAAASRDGDVTAARAAALRYGAVGAALLLPYYLALSLFPTTLLSLFSGAESAYVGLATPVRLFVAAYALFYVAQISAALLNGLGQSRRAFVAHAAGAAATLLVALPLAAAGGLHGAVWGGLVPAAVHAAASVLLLRRLAGSARRDCPAPVETCVAARPQAVQPA
jgi:O-antigen/teichoic acid export membrane protein